MSARTLLVEVGTEELPPKALRSLMEAFGRELGAALDQAQIAHGPVQALASPRRLAVLVEGVASRQDDREADSRRHRLREEMRRQR